MPITAQDTYRGHLLVKTPDTEATAGWWYVPALRRHLKIHGRWRAEIWHAPDRLTLARLRIFDHRGGAEWLDVAFRLGAHGAAPFLRADRFMVDGELPGWGEWPTEPTSSGRVPMATCVYCRGPVNHAEVLIIGPGPALSSVYPTLTAWAPRAHRTCHEQRSHPSQNGRKAPS